jgi:hypothetical protein
LDWSIISAAGGIVGLSMVFLEQGYLLSLQQFRSIMFEAPASSIRFVAFWWCLKNSKHYKVASAAAEQHCIKHIYTHLFRIGEHFFFSLKAFFLLLEGAKLLINEWCTIRTLARIGMEAEGYYL